MNPKKIDDKCFHYAVMVALRYEETESHPEGVSNIKPFINKLNWEGINYSSKLDDWKALEKHNPTNTFDILCIKEKEIYPAYILNFNSNCEKQIILLMIPNEKKKTCDYLAVNKLSTVLKGIT